MTSSRFIKYILVVALFSVLFSGGKGLKALETSGVGAEEDISTLQEDFEDLQRKEQEIREKLQELQEEKTSLNNEIEYIDGSISLTEVEISSLQGQIISKETELDTLSEDIGDLSLRIGRLEDALKYQGNIYINRARQSYLFSKLSPVEVLLTSKSMDDAITNLQYLQMFEDQDKQLLKEMKDLSILYNEEKNLLEDKREEIEEVQEQIVASKSNLEGKVLNLSDKKSAKTDLLVITESDEAIFQKELEKIKAEQSAISSFIYSLVSGNLEGGSKVKSGDVIGIQGSTGFSTGDHLHFGVYEECGDSWCSTNPNNYLDNELKYPLSSFEISQGYGCIHDSFARNAYPSCDGGAGGFHNALDMVGPTGIAVQAAGDGTLYYSTDSQGGKGAIIIHGDLKTIYWHLQ